LALNLAVVRASIDDRLATAFWALAQTAQPVSRRCPSCRRDLRQIQHAVGSERVELDVCTGCQLIWFDHGELERFGDARSLRAAAPQAVRQKTKREHDPAIVHSTALIVDGVGDVLELAWDIVSSWD
jgi:Zn-finger nucleic acid-binding protein